MLAISVIVCVYNCEKYLEACLDSILSQTFKDFELIVINDGSTDGSLAILEAYAEKSPQIRIVTQKNQGVYIARNRGLELATGEYVYFIDSDDTLTTDVAFEEIYAACKDGDLDMCFFNAKTSWSLDDDIPKSLKKPKRYIKDPMHGIVSGMELLRFYLAHDQVTFAVWFYFVRRDFLMQHHIRFIELRNIIHADVGFSTECCMRAKRVRHLPKAYYNYFRRANSIIVSHIALKNIHSMLQVLDKLCELALTEGLSHENYAVLALILFEKLQTIPGMFLTCMQKHVPLPELVARILRIKAIKAYYSAVHFIQQLASHDDGADT